MKVNADKGFKIIKYKYMENNVSLLKMESFWFLKNIMLIFNILCTKFYGLLKHY